MSPGRRTTRALAALLALAAAAGARDSSTPPKRFDPAGIGLLRTVAPGGDLCGVAFSADGRRLAVGIGSGVVVYETDHWREVQRLVGHPQTVFGLAWSPDSTLLAAGGFEGAVGVWDVRSGNYERTLEGHTSYVGGLAFSPDGKSLLTGSHDGTVRLWDPESGKERRSFGPLSGAGLAVAFSRDGRHAAAGLGGGEVRIWRTDGWEEERTLGLDGGGNAGWVGFTRDGARVAAASETSLVVAGVSAGAPSNRVEISGTGAGGVALSPDDRYAIVCGQDMAVRLYDLLRRGEAAGELRHHTGALAGLALRPDGRAFVTIGHDHHLKVWGRVPPGAPRVRTKGFCGIRVQADAQGRVVIADVIAGTAAQAAGMKVGDVLRSVGGVEIHNTVDSVDRIGTYFEGDEVEFVVERGGEARSLKFKLGKRPADLEN